VLSPPRLKEGVQRMLAKEDRPMLLSTCDGAVREPIREAPPVCLQDAIIFSNETPLPSRPAHLFSLSTTMPAASGVGPLSASSAPRAQTRSDSNSDFNISSKPSHFCEAFWPIWCAVSRARPRLSAPRRGHLQAPRVREPHSLTWPGASSPLPDPASPDISEALPR
jgi:hypothetical protein